MKNEMKTMQKFMLAAMTAGTLALGILPGCAVSRDQQTTGEYVDDATITAKVKSKFIENSSVDSAAISVETLKGTVQLSGFAKSNDEKATAGKLAKGVNGVKAVKNDLIVRP
jgi:osmotically-inducible protein OsmY